MTRELDFSLLPTLEVGHAWFQLDDHVKSALAVFPNVLIRAECALRFVIMRLDYLKSDPNKAEQMRDACLRAALAEFVSMQDMLSYDLKAAKVKGSSFRCNHSRNPLLHIIHELRNLHIHLQPVTSLVSKRTVFWGDSSKPPEAHQIDI